MCIVGAVLLIAVPLGVLAYFVYGGGYAANAGDAGYASYASFAGFSSFLNFSSVLLLQACVPVGIALLVLALARTMVWIICSSRRRAHVHSRHTSRHTDTIRTRNGHDT